MANETILYRFSRQNDTDSRACSRSCIMTFAEEIVWNFLSFFLPLCSVIDLYWDIIRSPLQSSSSSKKEIRALSTPAGYIRYRSDYLLILIHRQLEYPRLIETNEF